MAYIYLTSLFERHIVTTRPDTGASVVKYRNESEFEAAGFRAHRQNAADGVRPASSGVSNTLKIFRFVRWREQRIASSAK